MNITTLDSQNYKIVAGESTRKTWTILNFLWLYKDFLLQSTLSYPKKIIENTNGCDCFLLEKLNIPIQVWKKKSQIFFFKEALLLHSLLPSPLVLGRKDEPVESWKQKSLPSISPAAKLRKTCPALHLNNTVKLALVVGVEDDPAPRAWVWER